jgi:ABC-type nitrate/sulfonate/bicarbonate transport system permease component
MKYPKKKNIAYNILGVISIITAWQLGAYFTGNVDIFPSPIKSFITLTRITATENFWIHIGTTLFRGILGGILSLILGFVLGFLSSINAP